VQPVVDAAFVARVEHLAGLLRVHPDDRRLLRILRTARDVLGRLPAGTRARLGLAWHAAGDVESADDCRQWLRSIAPPVLLPDGFPGEDPIAVQALTLELDIVSGGANVDRERSAADLLLACLRGSASTYGRSCALTVLARTLPRTTAQRGVVAIECGTERRELELGDGAAAAVRCRFERAGPVRVRGPAGMALLVRVAAARVARASDHAAWAAPLQVERRWGEFVGDDARFEPRSTPLCVGNRLVLEIAVRSPVPMRRVVVDCPLPTGFEVVGKANSVQRFDDRVAFACDVDPALPTVLHLEVVPTLAGRFVWPPVTATPMYAAGSDGGSAGAFVEVAAAAAVDVPATVTAPSLWPPPPEPEPAPAPEPFVVAIEAIEAACAEGAEAPRSEAERQLAATVAFADLLRAEREPFQALHELTELVDRLDGDPDEQPTAERLWRARLFEQVRAHLVERTQQTLLATWPPVADAVAAQARAATVQRALWYWPPGPGLEPWVARWWDHVRAVVGPDELLRLVDGVPRDADLCAALREAVLVGNRDIARHAFASLPLHQRHSLPVAAVLERLGATSEVLAWAMADAAGQAEVRVRLQDPKFVRAGFLELHSSLPTAEWQLVPLEAFAAVAADHSDHGAEGEALTALVARLRASPIETSELQAAFAVTNVPVWRFVLGVVLRARNAQVKLARPADPRGDLWRQAQALGPGDVRAALGVLARNRTEGLDLDGDREWLACLVVPIVVASATPEQLGKAQRWLEGDDWRRVWSRLGAADRVQLITCFEGPLPDSFVPGTKPEAEAVWQACLRSPNEIGPILALLAAPVGFDHVRRNLESAKPGELVAIRRVYAERFRLDEATLAPRPGSEAAALFVRLGKHGLAGVRTAAEGERLRQARLLRGL
jgi:hypothetical protein